MAKKTLSDLGISVASQHTGRRRNAVSASRVSLADSMVSRINEKLGNDKLAITLQNDTQTDVAALSVTGWIKTGIWALDWLFGNWRGIPLGRMTAIWGGEGCGKSSLCQYLIRRFQRKNNGLALYMDYDNALDEDQLRRGQVDMKRVIVASVITLEEGYDTVQAGLDGLYGSRSVGRGATKKSKKSSSDVPAANKTDAPLLVVVDSISAAGPRELFDEDTAEEYHVGADARIISTQNKKMRQWLRGRPAHVIFLAESRANFGAVGRFAPQEKMAGAKSLRFAPSTILRVGNAGMIRKGDRVIGHRMYLQVDRKARLSKPGRRAEIVISYSHVPGEGGPHPAMSNWLFLDEVAKLVKPKGEAGYTIRGLEDAVGTFKKKDWPSVMAQHEKAIVAAIQAKLDESADPQA